MEVQIKNQQKIIKINHRKIKGIVKKILQYLEINERTELSILFTTDKFIKSLNEKYRGINKPTDVLAFSLSEKTIELPKIEKNILLGDIVISTETAQKQADILNHSVEKEIIVLLIHGLLHLLGYDHKIEKDNKAMIKKERELLKTFDL